jgi:hypothetical protein
MRFLNGLSPGTFSRSMALSVILSALLLSGCERISASTTSETSKMRPTSPISSLTNSKKASPMDGQGSVQNRRSTGPPDRYTNFIAYATPRFSASLRRSGCSSGDQIASRSNLSESSITSTFRNSRITRANRCESFSLISISKTVPHSLAANHRPSSRNSGESPGSVSRTSPIDRRRPLFKPPSSASGTGPTSAAFSRQRSSWPESSRLSTLVQPSFARSWTERSSALVSPRTRFRGSTNWSRVNSPKNFTNRRSGKLFPRSRSQL